MLELLLGVIFISWYDLSLLSSDLVALTQVRITLCATGFSLVGAWGGCRRVKAFPSFLLRGVPARALLVALTFLYFRHCRKCLKDKSKQKQYRESVKKNALQLSLFQTITNTTVHSYKPLNPQRYSCILRIRLMQRLRDGNSQVDALWRDTVI